MNLTKVLFATDFSDHSQAAARFAATLARDAGATLIVVHVIELPPPYGAAGPYVGEFIDQNERLLKGMLDDIATDSGVPNHETHLLVGPPASEIVRFAEQEGVDLIVMATHGRTGVTRLLMGSVAEAVLRRAPCPLLTIRQPEAVLAGEPA
jgi:nucleotide-binding universal stress UspA family protein